MGVRQMILRCCLLATMCLGCAQGKPQSVDASRTGRGISPSLLNSNDATPGPEDLISQPLAGMEAPAPMTPMVDFEGETCRVGAQFVCQCPDGASGVKSCVEDPNSPTGGAYGECQNCGGGPATPSSNGGDVAADPNAPPCENGVKDGEESDVDCGGLCTPCEVGRSCVRGIDCASLNCEGGTCAEAQEAAPVMSSNPPPNREAAGILGGGGGSCGACDNPCFPVGVLSCCTPLGTCGCTWAPGAYCL